LIEPLQPSIPAAKRLFIGFECLLQGHSLRECCKMAEVHTPTPLYHRIYAVMRERILKHYYQEDFYLPSEAELAENFSASRITIRKAMEMLTAEGLVTRARGRGTFINSSNRANKVNRVVVSNINSLFSYLNAVGTSTKLKVVGLDTGEVPPRISALMGTLPTEELVRATRVRSLEGTPYSLSISYLLPEVGGTLTRRDLASTTMIDLVQRSGLVVEHVEQILTATIADEYSGKHLEVPIGTPLMKMTRVFFRDDMKPFYAAEIFYCADRYEYRVSLKREDGKDFSLES
jgi:GntR family transcriptional regulator